jgi:hypothetical protein
MGHNFVNGRLSSHVCATESVVALKGFGYRKVEWGKTTENVVSRACDALKGESPKS